MICFLFMAQSNKGRGGFVQTHYLAAPQSSGTSKPSTRCSATDSHKNKKGAQQNWQERVHGRLLSQGGLWARATSGTHHFSQFLLVRAESCGHAKLQGSLGNVVKLYTQTEEMGLENI